MFMSIILWAQVAVFTHVISDDVDDWDWWFLGRAPRTRKTLPNFLKSCRVARHSRVFRRLTGSQRTPGNGASQVMFFHFVEQLYLGNPQRKRVLPDPQWNLNLLL